MLIHGEPTSDNLAHDGIGDQRISGQTAKSDLPLLQRRHQIENQPNLPPSIALHGFGLA